MSESSDFKVVYLGQDLDYWEKIKERFRSTYQKKFHFYHLLPNETDSAEEIYTHIAQLYPQVFYIDIMYDYQFCVKLIKYISRNNITKLISTVALYGQTQYKDQVSRVMMAGARLHQIKCLEISDVVYNPISFYDINQAVNPNYSTAETNEDSELIQDLRVAYYNETHLTVETNSPLKVGEIINLEPSFLSTVLESNKVIVEEVRDSNLYYNLRYSVDLRLLCVAIDEFEPELREEILKKKAGDNFDYGEFLKKRSNKTFKFFYLPVLSQLKDIVKKNKDKNIPKAVKILAVDNNLDVFNEIASFKKSIPYSINVQSSLHGNRYQIKRIMPHVITYCLEKEISSDVKFKNDVIGLNKIIKAISNIEKFEPIIVVFKDKNHQISKKDIDTYKRLILHDSKISLDTVLKLAESVDQSLPMIEKTPQNRVYLGTFDSENLLMFKREIKIISLTESIMYFTTTEEIPDWTIFHIEEPFPMLITVVPQKEDSNFNGQENVYRALINGLGESGKARIRTYVNSLIYKSSQQ